MTRRLVAMSPRRWHKKGKYGPLGVVMRRLGPGKILSLEPRVVERCVWALREDVLCSHVATFLKALLGAVLAEEPER